MAENKNSLYNEEVIDLRELIQTVWHKKWIIIMITFLAGLSVLLISFFLIPKRYQAAAFITITEPRLRTELETSIQANPVLLETGGLSKLAESYELQELTFLSLGITEYEQQRTYEFSAFLQGEGQIRLEIEADGSALAAAAANAWAEVVIERFNEIYGTNEGSFRILELEVTQAKDNWESAQYALQSYLPQSQLDSLQLQLSAVRSLLAKHLHEIDNNQLLISDIQTLQEQIENLDPAQPLSTGTGLSLITLQQRASAVQDETPFQILLDQSMKLDLTVAEAGSILELLTDALGSQNQQLGEDILSLEDEISDLVLFLEMEQYQLDQLNQERDLARQSYTALSSQLEETHITMAQEDRPAKLGAKAVEPKVPSGPRLLLNSALASMIGAMLAVSVVLFRNWWIEEY